MDTLYVSNRIFINSDQYPEQFAGGILVSGIDGKVVQIFDKPENVQDYLKDNEAEVYDFGDLVVMPGLIDSHVHINEPGRTEWEGFYTATKAAAAGGFTTICDMPLNSIPPTTTMANLRTKLNAARGKIFVDVAFWGGVVPGNADELREMIYAGVVGFKCFLCPSGVDEFGHVGEKDLHVALRKMEGTGTVLAFHAEVECKGHEGHHTPEENPKKYQTFLQSRPDQMEAEAIELVSKLSQQYDVPCHIVHLSAARALPSIRKARSNGARLTVETCHHYLSIAAEDIPDAHTEFKCCPPIRARSNQELLWQAVCDGDINMVVSDHSPSTPGMKLLTSGSKNRGDFLKAWGGISSVQFGLPLFWTNCQKYGLKIPDLIRLLCTEPAKMCGLDSLKGRLEPGYDGDICVWDPEDTFTVTRDIIEFQNKANPYMDRKLRGVVHASFIRGYPVYRQTEKFGAPTGNILLKKVSRRGSKAIKFN